MKGTFIFTLLAIGAHACTCVDARPKSRPNTVGAQTALHDASVVFRGRVLKVELLPQHPEMHGRKRYRTTFQVLKYWKGAAKNTIALYDLDPGTDCEGAGFEIGPEYLVFARISPAKDYRLGDFFWFGWTDVVPQGAPILQANVACTPWGETSTTLVQRAMRELGRGRVPPKR